MNLHCNGDNNYLFVNGKEIYKFKANNKNINFPTQFCLVSMPEKRDVVELKKVSLKGNVHVFSVDYNAIDKSDIQNIPKSI